ncbi:hypothetical protein Celaphus_00010883 [Cervus elaphus hippelaphus]|uniref:Uncharacterized protein n=1 Tax=Cervus elaphus hippelaphus TaxID=46360 RepID=A0A212CQN8_CEREH|nr:hypothetical protein Celaphus_00010883 [Cervus elaphus hippelaphus]
MSPPDSTNLDAATTFPKLYLPLPLIEIADKVFWNRDTEKEKKYEKRYKDEQRRTDERFAMLAARLETPCYHSLSVLQKWSVLATPINYSVSCSAAPRPQRQPKARPEQASYNGELYKLTRYINVTSGKG